MRSPLAKLGVPIALALTAACAHIDYRDALGYRARQAALHKDVSSFDDLMAEAAEAEPGPPLRDPRRTVLTHFLDLADQPGFAARIEAWRARGLIADDMHCAVDNAVFAATLDADPAVAATAARRVLERARATARRAPEAPNAEIEGCLVESPPLIRTATAALTPYLDLVRDPETPPRLRQAVLTGLTLRTHFGPPPSWSSTAAPSADTLRAAVRSDAWGWAQRVRWVTAALADLPDLAVATARGALEVEAALLGAEHSLLASVAEDPSPARRRLAWAWVATLAPRDPIPALSGLGLYAHEREPLAATFWYVCAVTEAGEDGRHRAAVLRFDAEPEAPWAPVCEGRRMRLGPYPLERVARGRAAARLRARAPGARLYVDEREIFGAD